MLKFGKWARIEEAITNGIDIFIGAGITRYEETKPYVDLCGEDETLTGIVLGLNTAWETIPSQGYYYNDFDVPFGTGKKIQIGIPVPNETVNLILLETNTTIEVEDRLKCVAGVFQRAGTNDSYQYVAEEPSSAAANTRKYIYAQYVKVV